MRPLIARPAPRGRLRGARAGRPAARRGRSRARRPQAGAASYYFMLGRHLEGEGKLDEAIAAHKQAIALAPDSAELRAELAGLYARNDRAAEALETAQAALERDPDNQEANRILGTIYAALSEQRQPIRPGDNPAEYPARGDRRAREGPRATAPFDLNLDLMLGRLYAQTGAFDKALPLLRHVVDDQPGYQEGALLLAAAQESAGRRTTRSRRCEQTLAGQSGLLPRPAPAGRDLRARGALARGGAGAGAGAGAEHPNTALMPAARGRADQRRQGGRGARRSAGAGRRVDDARPGHALPARRGAARRPRPGRRRSDRAQAAGRRIRTTSAACTCCR